MSYCIIISRSLTHAQQMAAVLRRADIPTQLIRTPTVLQKEGCGSALRIDRRSLPAARTALRLAGAAPLRLYITGRDGGYQEVTLDLP